MTRYGIALPASKGAHGSDYVLGQLDLWEAETGVYPATVPLFWRLEHPPRGFPDQRRLEIGLAARTIDPMYYVRSRIEDPVELRELASGFAGELLAADAADLSPVVRINQEPNGDWPAPWAGWSPHQYIVLFGVVADAIHAEAPLARTFYCPILERKEQLAEFERYYPGDEWADVVGFDSYNHDSSRPVVNRWERAVAECDRFAPGKPVIVGETGVRRGLPGRAKWVRKLGEVQGIETIVYLDWDMDQTRWPGHRWRMNGAMRREYRRLDRG